MKAKFKVEYRSVSLVSEFHVHIVVEVDKNMSIDNIIQTAHMSINERYKVTIPYEWFSQHAKVFKSKEEWVLI